MKINSKISLAFFALVLVQGLVDGMIIKKDFKGRPRLHEEKEGGRMERRLMDEIKKEKEKNKMLKDLLKKQENLSQELDKKMLDTTNGNSDKANKTTENSSKQDKNLDDKSVDNKTRKLAQATDSPKTIDSKKEKPSKVAKSVNVENSRKLNQTGGSFKNEKQSKSVVNNSKKIDKNFADSKSKSNFDSKKQSQNNNTRKLNDFALRKRLETAPRLNADSTRKVLRKAVVQKISVPSQKFKPSLPAKKAFTNNQKSVKRQLKATQAQNKRPTKKLALQGHKDITAKPLAKRVAVNQINTKKNTGPHSTNGSLRGNKRSLTQNKKSPSNRLAVQKPNKNAHIAANKNLKKIYSKPVVNKRQLSRTDNKNFASNKRINAKLPEKKKEPVRWTKQSRKLVDKSGKKQKHSSRVLEEEESDYPVKLMNASISYPILGMVNLGSGEYDLHIS